MHAAVHHVAGQLLLRYPRLAVSSGRWLLSVRSWLPWLVVDRMRENLEVAFPELTEAACMSLARRCVEDIQLDGIHQNRLQLLSRHQLLTVIDAVEIRGHEYLQHAYGDGRPVIFVTAHYGAYMLGALKAALAFPDRKVNFFYNPTARNAYATTSDALLSLVNDTCGILHATPKGVVGAMKCLGRGESLCIVADQLTADGEVVYVPFFGRFYGAMQGIAYFAQRSGARIIPVFAQTNLHGRTTMEMLPAIDYAEPTLSSEEQLYRTTCAVFYAFERYIRMAPTHWKYWATFKQCSLKAPYPAANRSDARKQLVKLESMLSYDRTLADDSDIWGTARSLFSDESEVDQQLGAPNAAVHE